MKARAAIVRAIDLVLALVVVAVVIGADVALTYRALIHWAAGIPVWVAGAAALLDALAVGYMLTVSFIEKAPGNYYADDDE